MSALPHNTPQLSGKTLVLGGARSGKSRYAEQLFHCQEGTVCYIATAQAFDAEMEARIAAHRARRDSRWQTLEAPLDLVAALHSAAALKQPILVDCLTLWLSNLMLAEMDLDAQIRELLENLTQLDVPLVMVSNEVGLGIVPENALARAFRDHAGYLNQRLAAAADQVVFLAAGLPLPLKAPEGDTP
ncbi:MAG: bifunctional adenosylcobinamide kinase/adenosylcobinamide-phosphate guanylyltransferase [Pseudomonadota bacterium]